MNIQEYLKESGLTKNEATIYTTLLNLGPSHAGLISSRSGLHRRVVYDTLNLLIQKGLVAYIKKNNIKLFQSTNPSRFIDILEEKKSHIQEIMPDLISLFTQTKEKEETNFYKGKSGLKSIFEDQLLSKEIMIIGASELAYEVLQFYFKWYDKKRVERKIISKIIFHKPEKKIKIPLSEVKYFPQKYSSPLAVNIYNNKVALILWRKENPFAIVINDKEVFQSYKKYFEFIWKNAKK